MFIKVTNYQKNIIVRCHTTQQEQVDVIDKLFSEFGKVSVSYNNGHFHVNCFLNNSFNFLLSKDSNCWAIVRNNDNLAIPFIAGYVEAEGNFILNQNRARFKIDSYDRDILEWMYNWLNSSNIQN